MRHPNKGEFRREAQSQEMILYSPDVMSCGCGAWYFVLPKVGLGLLPIIFAFWLATKGLAWYKIVLLCDW